MDEKTLRNLLVRAERWRNQAMQGIGANITAGEAKQVKLALEFALELLSAHEAQRGAVELQERPDESDQEQPVRTQTRKTPKAKV